MICFPTDLEHDNSHTTLYKSSVTLIARMWTPSNLSFFSDSANPSFHWSPASVIWVVTVCVCTIGLLVLTAISLRTWYLPKKKLEENEEIVESVTTIEASKLIAT